MQNTECIRTVRVNEGVEKDVRIQTVLRGLEARDLNVGIHLGGYLLMHINVEI